MKGIQVQGAGQAAVVELPQPERKEGYAIVKVMAASICGTDVSTYRGTNVNVSSYPIVIGHETAGIVEDVDENNPHGIKKGDHVVLDPYLYCGACYPCSQGKTNCCETLHCLGVHCDGSMCEYFAHPVHMLRKVPQDMPWERVPLAEPLVISMHGLHTCQLKAGEHIAIIGAGAIGLLAGMGALAYDATPILVDVVDERLELARSFGIPYTVNPAKEDAVARIMEITKNRGVECVMEASGSDAGVRSAIDYAAYTGRIALTGWPKHEITLPTNLITKKELQIRGSRNGAGEFEEAIQLIYTGRVPAEKIISKVVPYDQLPHMLGELSEHPGDYLKVVGLFHREG